MKRPAEEQPVAVTCRRCNKGQQTSVIIAGILLCGDCFLRVALRYETEAAAAGRLMASGGRAHPHRPSATATADERSS